MTFLVACSGTPATDPAAQPSAEGVLGSADPTVTPSPVVAEPSPIITPSPVVAPPEPSPDDDCYTYDPQMLIKNYEAGVHVIRVDHGEEIIRVYGGPDDPIGAAALAVATRFETVCYIGRGNSFDSPTYVFEYWRHPSAMIHPNEPADLFSECVEYRPSDLRGNPNPDGPGWVARAGANVLQVFANRADAEAGLAILDLRSMICYLHTRTPAPENAPADIAYYFDSGD